VAGSASYTITATARDSAGSGQRGEQHLQLQRERGSLSATSCSTATSGGAGNCFGELQPSVAGSYSVSATLGGSGRPGQPGTAALRLAPQPRPNCGVAFQQWPKIRATAAMRRRP
jgi:hypothetical protein